MADYASNKVPELKKMLVERGLSDKGNKAELVARLKENDESKGEKADEITWTDDAPAAATTEAPAAEAPKEPAPTPAVGTTQAPAEAAVAEAAQEAAVEGAEPAEPTAPAVSYAAGLNDTTADEEARRRAERAKRFGIEEDEEAKLKAERAKRFGVEEGNLVGGLNSALPERRERKARGNGQGVETGRVGKDRKGGRGGNDRRGGKRQGGRGRDGGRGEKKSGSGILDDAAERAKAEARAARFATS